MDKAQIIFFAVQFINVLRSLIVYAILARVLVSWFTMGQYSRPGRIVQIINDVTDPLINLARKLPHRIGMIDLSPIIVMLGADLLADLSVKLLVNLL